MQKTSKIFVAGHKGLVGSSLYRKLKDLGYTNLITRSHQELDLTDKEAVNDFFAKEKPDYVFLAAAKVGGIIINNEEPAEFLYENSMLELNVINACYKYHIKRLLFLASSCIFPKNAPEPIKEDALLTGSYEPTNEGYAIAKTLGVKYVDYLNKEYNLNYISLMPTNLYGINDNYDLRRSHVIPALIRKIDEAKNNNKKEVILLGTGKPLREFMLSDDLASIAISLMNNPNSKGLINVGSGEELTIKELAKKIQNIIGYKGKIVFDSNYPDGMKRKRLDLTKLNNYGLKAETPLDKGLLIAYEDYQKRLK